MPNTEITEPLMSISNYGLSVLSEDVAVKLEKKKLSASLIRDINEGCPAAWAANNFVLKELIEEEPDTAASRGSLFHKVMEVVFEWEPKKRTRENINTIAIPETLDSDEFSFFKGNM